MTTWIESIRNGLTIAGVYTVLIFIPVVIANIKFNRGHYNLAKIAADFIFYVYMCVVFALVFLPLPTTGTVLEGRSIRLIPGNSVIDVIKDFSVIGVAQIIFNIVMTIPFGAYLVYVRKLDMKKVALYTFMFSLFIEIGQYTGLFFIYEGSYRLCDVDDLICNTLGGVIGAYVILKVNILPDIENFERRILALA